MSLQLRIRRAEPEEANALTSLCMRSKAYWGYDADFLRQAAPALEITATMISNSVVLVAEDRDGNHLGVAAVQPIDGQGKYDLSRLFVDPRAIRTGVGRALFEAVVGLMQQNGAKCLRILSDPFAQAFYERVGAARIGDAPSDAIPERRLPLLEYEIPSV